MNEVEPKTRPDKLTVKNWWKNAFQKRLRSQRMMIESRFPDQISIIVPYPELVRAEYKLSSALLENPDEILRWGGQALFDLFPPDVRKRAPSRSVRPIIRITELKEFRAMNIKDMRSEHVGQLWSFTGRIRKSQRVTSKIKVAQWQCMRCDHSFKLPVMGLELEEPLVCEGDCGSARGRTRFTLIEEWSEFVDFQVVYLEELLGLTEGQPERRMVFLWDDLTGLFPCNEATVNGIVKLIQTKKQRTAVFETYIRAVSVEVENIREPVNITADDEKKIIEVATGKNPMDRLRASVAPSILGMKDEKNAVILQQAGGVTRVMPDGTKKRGLIHVLIVGDPGIAKSTLLKVVPSISPIGLYGSGEGTTGGGLTFTMARDEFDGTWSVEMGLFAMCDGGICCFDEFDKTSKEDRKRMHGALASGALEVAKAGIVTTLRADASLLAGANPKHGRFDICRPMSEQIDLNQAMITRFDLIFSVTDAPDDDMDGKIADHIIAGHRGDFENQIPEFDAEFLRKFFYYVRKNFKPVMPKAIGDKLKLKYQILRREIHGISPRALEAMIRLSAAHAKIRASNEVNEDDIEFALNIFKNYLKSVSRDADTGEVDADIIMIGLGKSQRDRHWALLEIIKDIQGETGAPIDEIKLVAEERGLPPNKIEDDIEILKHRGRIFERFENKFKLA